MMLVFGCTGQVATELHNLGSVTCLNRVDADLADADHCANIVREYKPRVVINAAAYTDVDKAEVNESVASVINGETPTAIACACAELNIPIIHISTDYVFSGHGSQPWKPNDTPLPQNAYGRSKLIGEKGILDSGAVHAVLRTSWVFSAHRKNFLKTILKVAESHDVIRVVSDQIGGPTPARDIALACLRIAEQLLQDPSRSGIYHFSGSPNVSWAEFASEILVKAGLTSKIAEIRTEEYSTVAARPLNSRLNCELTERVFGLGSPCWKTAVNEIVKELKVK